jgi:peptidoglycan hydrolase-like protein with peptidoglycan-binding domain
MSILSDPEIQSALDYNAGREALDDPGFIGDIQELLGIARSEQLDAVLVEAVAAWQMQQGLEVDGKVGPNTERSLRRALSWQPAALHALPPITRRWHFDHAELAPFPYSDRQLEAVTGTGSWSAGAIRLVTGYDAARRTVNRGWDSFTTLDTFSIGIAHWWSDTAPELLAEIARREPELAAWAWEIIAWSEFDGPAPDAAADLLQGLDFSVPAQRQDGSPVVFPAG